jgi:hypothetical protein
MISFRKAVGYLLGVSLISRVSDQKGTDPESYDVHRLVHLSMRTYIRVTGTRRGNDLEEKSPQNRFEPVSRLFPTFRYEDQSISSACLLHALAVIPYSDNAELRENFASYLYFKGEYRAVKGRLVRCLKIRERWGSDTLSVTGRSILRARRSRQSTRMVGRAPAGLEKLVGTDDTVNQVANIGFFEIRIRFRRISFDLKIFDYAAVDLLLSVDDDILVESFKVMLCVCQHILNRFRSERAESET